jgi:hypothetical protein
LKLTIEVNVNAETNFETIFFFSEPCKGPSHETYAATTGSGWTF